MANFHPLQTFTHLRNRLDSAKRDKDYTVNKLVAFLREKEAEEKTLRDAIEERKKQIESIRAEFRLLHDDLRDYPQAQRTATIFADGKEV